MYRANGRGGACAPRREETTIDRGTLATDPKYRGAPEPQYGAVNCALLGIDLLCSQTASGFLGTSAPACGQSGRFGHCIVSTLMCIEQVEQLSKIMPCR